MFAAALLLFGIMAYIKLPLNLLPDTQFPILTIQTVYPGASPDQIENLITKKIEDEISSISMIDSITSYSMNSASVIIVQFDLDKDVDVANQEVKTKLDSIAGDLPDNAQTPSLSKVDLTATSVINLVLSGDLEPEELSALAEGPVKDALSKISGVGTVNISGGRDREVRVTLDNRTVFENSLNLTQLAGIIAQSNLDMPGGNFTNEEEEYGVRLEGEISGLEELSRIMVPTSSGFRELGHLADISNGPEVVRERVSFFDLEAGTGDDEVISLSVIKSAEGNPVAISDEIKNRLPSIEERLPGGVSLQIAKDESLQIENTFNDTLSNIIMGIVLTALIILVFLHDLRSTLIVALSMPLSIIPTFIILDSMGISLNLLSMMGISVSVGVLVQNSVVVLENIFRHRKMGHDGKESASRGTGEVTLAVIASTMTNVCVFLPLGLMDGMAGLLIKDFAITVVIATLFSLLVSFTLTPMLASLILKGQMGTKKGVGLFIENAFAAVERAYARALSAILKSRLRSSVVIITTIGVFVIAMLQFGKIPFENMPAMDSGNIHAEVELPYDASLEQTAEKLEEIQSILMGNDEIEKIMTSLGSLSGTDAGTNLAKITINLIDSDQRDSSFVLAEKMGRQLAHVTNAEIRIAASSGMGAMAGSPVNFYLQSDDSGELLRLSRDFEEILKTIPGLTSVDSSVKPGKPEIVLTPDRQALSNEAMTVQDLAMAMRASIEGLVLTQLKEEKGEYDIRVSVREADVSTPEAIGNIAIAARSGVYPLSRFAEVSFGSSTGNLLRIDKGSSVEFTADLLSGYVIGDVTEIIEETADQFLPEEVEFKWGGDAEMMKETVSNMAQAFIIAIVLTYMLLAAVLEKLGQPLLILSTVPLSLIGVVALTLATGTTMNLVSMMAIIMLVGLVVNNAILILDYTNQLRREGLSVHDALIKACPTKLQPILMANLATILGMLPMAMGIGASGAEMRQPLGLVSIGGLLAATVLTLFVIPAIENALEGKKEMKHEK